MLDELYADQNAVFEHRVTKHFQAYLAAINDFAERSAFVLSRLAVA